MTQKTTGLYEKVFLYYPLTTFKHTKLKKIIASVKNYFLAIMQNLKETVNEPG